MHRLLIAVLLIIPLVVPGCSDKEATTASATAEVKKEAREAEICGEHGVLESLCTKCNPKLAPIFQSKGDWCAEHGFPESVCPLCHPERGGKPTMDVTVDDAPADGTRVVLRGKDTARLAGIETMEALPSRGRAEIIAPVVISYDAARVARVGARAPGTVKRVSVDIGTWVRAGALLAEVESAVVSIEQSRMAATLSRVRTAEANYHREAALEAKGISARKEVLAAQQSLREATAELESLQASLRGVGADNGSSGTYSVKAAVSGVITQRTVSADQYVDFQTPLFEIVDTSSLWAEVALPEAELGAVKAGTPVVITLDGLGGREFRGTIAHIAPIVDTPTRTVKGRVRLGNPDGLLRANMYGQARIPVGGPRSSSAVPRGAIQRAKSVRLVFVRLGPGEYEARRVQVASSHGSGDLLEIASGVQAGEEIVVAGSFFLKTETLKDSIGAGCCEVDNK